MRYLGAVLLLAALSLSAGCGPIVSGVQTIKANVAISSAETAGAQRLAIYEYTAAREYLQKSREEHAYSDFWAARLYADKALDYALKARQKAESAADTEQLIILPEEPAPAAPPPPPPQDAPVIVPVP